MGVGGGGAVDSNFGSERTVELFCGKLLLTETPTCFSICESRSPLAREVLLCLLKQLHFLKTRSNRSLGECVRYVC